LLADPLVRAWVGPAFSASVPVLQLLALTLVFRVGNATAATLLKGAGRHRFVAVVNVSTGLVNLALSVILVRTMGLVGVALGTLVPVGLAAVFVIFPAGCRRVGLPWYGAAYKAVWPAVWPVVVMTAYIAATRRLLVTSLAGVGAEMVVALALYATVFLFFAIGAEERRLYLVRAFELTAGWRQSSRTVPEGA
jgi:O-antigen/teichoic acid export membrane protein